MRVLSAIPDPRYGGPTTRSLDVALPLRKRGIETVFLLPKGDDEFADAAKAEGFDVVRMRQSRIRAPRRVADNARFLLEFKDCTSEAAGIIKQQRIDVVHVNGPLNYQVALAANKSNAATVWHFNDTLTPAPLRQLSSQLARRWADVIAVAADAVHDYYFSKDIASETVYAPVDVKTFDPSQISEREQQHRTELGIGDDSLIIGTVGNLNPTKGHKYLIEAIAEVRDQIEKNNIHLVVVGKKLASRQEYYEKLCQQVRRRDLENVVTFTGWRSDIPEILNTFDIFVLSSITEACPIVVLEAMAMGCPVIATDVGGVCEQIPGKDFGWVVPRKNANALAGALITAINSPDERRERGKRARKRAKDKFSLERCVERHTAIYNDAIRTE